MGGSYRKADVGSAELSDRAVALVVAEAGALPGGAVTGVIPSLVGRGLQFLNFNQMKTHAGSPLGKQLE